MSLMKNRDLVQYLRLAAGFAIVAGAVAARADLRYTVDPKGSFLMASSNDKVSKPLVLRLADMGIGAGDVLSLKQLGAFKYGSDRPETATSMIAVFSRTDGLDATSARNRVLGAIRAGNGTFDPATYNGRLWTDIPEDFGVSATGSKVVVPAGAAFLMVSAKDSAYSDNIDTNNDYGVSITVLGKPSGAGRNLLSRAIVAGKWANSGAFAVNSDGLIGGWVGTYTTRYATLFASSDFSATDYYGLGYSAIYGLNKAGTVVGEALTAKTNIGAFSAVGKTPTDLKNLGRATAINTAGTIAGYKLNPTGYADPFVVTAGKLKLVNQQSSHHAVASGINDNGEVVGFAVDADGNPHGWYGKPDGKEGYTIDTLGLSSTNVFVAINNSGQIAGNYVSGDTLHAFTYDTKNGFKDIGQLVAGGSAEATGINNLGQVVGVASNADGEDHAFVYDGKKMIDLGTLDGNLSIANAINDSGMIVGTSLDATGHETAFYTYTVPPIDMSVTPALVRGGLSATGTVNLKYAINANTVVTLSTGASALTIPATVTIPAGSTSATFTIKSTQVAALETDAINGAAGGNTCTASLKVRSVGVTGISVSPDPVAEGGTTTGTVTLEEVPTAGDITVSLSTNRTDLVKFPATVVVPKGKTTATFSITANAVDANAVVTMTASTDSTTASKAFTIRPMSLTSVTVDNNYLVEGAKALGTVTLERPAPAGGKTVTLSTSDASLVIPSKVAIPAGAQSATFEVSADTVDAQTKVTLTADYFGGRQTASVTIRPVAVTAVVPGASTMTEGGTQQVKVKLESAAPAKGRIVTLSGDAIFSMPQQVKVPAGATVATFDLKTKGTSVNVLGGITGTTPGGAKSTKVTVTPIKDYTATFALNYFPEGSTVPLTVTIGGAAPVGGKTIALARSNKSITIPTSVIIPEGATSVAVPVYGNETDANTPFNISVTVNGITKKVPGTVRSNSLKNLYLSLYTVKGGTSQTGGFDLEFPALASGKTIKLSTDNPLVTIDASVFVSAGKQSGVFNLKTSAVTKSITVTVTAQCGDRVARTILTVNP